MNALAKLERFRRRRLSNQSARIMAGLLLEAGIPVGAALSQAGIRAADLESPDAILTGQQELRLVEAFVERTRGMAGLWLELGFRYRLLTYGLFGLAILNARSVARAVEIATSFHELAFTLIEYSLVRDRDGRILGLEGDVAAVPEGLRSFMIERDIAAIRRLLDDMVDGHFPIREFRVAFSPSAKPSTYNQRLGAPIRFDAERTQVLFAAPWRQLEMPYANPLLEDTYERQCREVLASLAMRSSGVEEVVDLLLRCKGEWPTIEEAAARLALSSRTLRRRLNEEGASFRGLIDEVRRKQAKELLGHTRLSVEQVADSLGYAETASFTHAFKRWTGSAPRSYRSSPK